MVVKGFPIARPSSTIHWDSARLNITGQELSKTVLDTEPRIVLAGARGSRDGDKASSVSIIPYMMMPGDENSRGGASCTRC